MRSGFALSVASSWFVVAAFASAADAVDGRATIKGLLLRAAERVQRFEEDFSTVISLEIYEQHAEQRREAPRKTWMPISSEARTLRSEMLLIRVPERQTWLTVRNVLTVDGHPVPDSADRLERALASAGSGVLRALADEGARFNIGMIRRNVNDPTFALRFLERESQPDFTFALEGRDLVNDQDAWKLSFAERRSPSLVRGNRNEDLPAKGSIWLSGDGNVLRTSLTITDKHTHLEATTVVHYGEEARLGMRVPVRMAESYVERIGPVEERITCTATYSDFRRFETSGRLVGPR